MTVFRTVSSVQVLFNKPFSACVCATSSGDTVNVSLPTGRGVVHFETEIVLQVGPANTISDVTLGLDLTLRDVQKGLKQNGHPWEIGKVFPGSAVIGPWHSLAGKNYLDQEFTLHIDSELRQKGVGRDMRLKPIDTIKFIQQFYEVCEGDLIFTGTPAGRTDLLQDCQQSFLLPVLSACRDALCLLSRQSDVLHGHIVFKAWHDAHIQYAILEVSACSG